MVTLILFTSMEYFNLKLFQGRVKLCRVNESIIVCVKSLEILDGGIEPFRLLQSDQTVPVEIEAEKVFHRMAVDQVGVELTIGLGDGCRCWSFHSSPPAGLDQPPAPAPSRLGSITAGWRFDEKQRGDEEERDPHGQGTLKSELESSQTDFGVAKNAKISTSALFGLKIAQTCKSSKCPIHHNTAQCPNWTSPNPFLCFVFSSEHFCHLCLMCTAGYTSCSNA